MLLCYNKNVKKKKPVFVANPDSFTISFLLTYWTEEPLSINEAKKDFDIAFNLGSALLERATMLI